MKEPELIEGELMILTMAELLIEMKKMKRNFQLQEGIQLQRQIVG